MYVASHFLTFPDSCKPQPNRRTFYERRVGDNTVTIVVGGAGIVISVAMNSLLAIDVHKKEHNGPCFEHSSRSWRGTLINLIIPVIGQIP